MWKREYVDDDDYVVRDGESVRCSVLLMDAMQRKIAGVDLVDLSDHRPHFLTDTMDVRRIARDARRAWRQGRTDPSRADEVERRLEREKGKYA